MGKLAISRERESYFQGKIFPPRENFASKDVMGIFSWMYQDKKSRKRSEKSKKSLKMGLFDFSDLFRDFFQTFGTPGPGDFFETFLRLFGFGPRDSFSQVHGTIFSWIYQDLFDHNKGQKSAILGHCLYRILLSKF